MESGEKSFMTEEILLQELGLMVLEILSGIMPIRNPIFG